MASTWQQDKKLATCHLEKEEVAIADGASHHLIYLKCICVCVSHSLPNDDFSLSSVIPCMCYYMCYYMCHYMLKVPVATLFINSIKETMSFHFSFTTENTVSCCTIGTQVLKLHLDGLCYHSHLKFWGSINIGCRGVSIFNTKHLKMVKDDLGLHKKLRKQGKQS